MLLTGVSKIMLSPTATLWDARKCDTHMVGGGEALLSSVFSEQTDTVEAVYNHRTLRNFNTSV